MEIIALLMGAVLAPGPSSQAATTTVAASEELERRVEALVERHVQLPGLAIFVVHGEERYGAAAGPADPAGAPLTVDTPVRIASNTKTFTAATYLRLWEQGRVALGASARQLLDPELAGTLADFGYDVDAITARHLLMHVAGLPDHADADYVARVRSDPSREWTRAGQLALLEGREPLWDAGHAFTYSDTGYILLGHAIERATGRTLAAAAREQLGFERLGLSTTSWELVEPPPAGAPPRAHQYLEGEPTHGWSATIDLYGGGGLLCSVRDLAGFTAALHRGEVFDEPATLELMRTAPGHPNPEAYRIGLFPRRLNGREAWSHSGFWGTQAIYVPELDLAVAGVALDQAGFAVMSQALVETVGALGDRSSD